MRLALLVLSSTLALQGCGVVYNQTVVRGVPAEELSQAEPLEVSVIPVNPSVIRLANSSPYKARPLPEWFFDVPQAAAAPSGVLPRSTASPRPRTTDRQTNLPADLSPKAYRIGVTDVIIIRTNPTNPDVPGPFNGGFQPFEVGPDGTADLPVLGQFALAGLTVDELKQRLNSAIADGGSDQIVDLRVSEYKSSRVAISGAVRSPLLASLNQKPLYLDEALQIAGGTTTNDPRNTMIRIYRGDRAYQVLESDLYDNNRLARVPLQNDDRIFVENLRQIDEERVRFDQDLRLQETELNRRRAAVGDARNAYLNAVNLGGVNRDYVYIAGAVSVQGRFTLPFEQGAVVADALYFEARGLERQDGDPKHIYVIRGNEDGDEVSAYWIDTRNAANLIMATRLELRPKDVVFGSNQPISDWNRTIQQILPSFGLVNTVLDSRFKVADTRLRNQQIGN